MESTPSAPPSPIPAAPSDGAVAGGSLVEDVSIELTKLEELIEHNLAFERGVSLCEVNRQFENTGHTYAAVLESGVVIGLCSRESVMLLVEGAEVDSTTPQEPIGQHLLPEPLIIGVNTGLKKALDLAFERTGSRFLQHVIVVDSLESRHFIGLVPLRRLVEMQSKLLTEQVQKLSRKEDLLRSTIQQQFRTTVELRRAQNRDNNYKQMLRSTVQQQFRTTMELRRSQARYTMLFENSGVGVALINSEGQVSTTNRYLSKLLGAGGAGSSDEPIHFLKFLAEGDRQEFLQSLKKQAGEGERAACVHQEFTVQLPTSQEAVLHFTVNFIPETNQHCVCIADVTEERRLQRHLLQKEKDVLLDSFVGGIAHELNNKVLPLLGFTELLIAETSGPIDPAKIQHYGDIIKKSSSDCAAIVRQLLSLCKPTTGEAQACDLRAISKEALSFLLFRIRDANVTVTEEYEPEVVPVHVDPAQIKQVLINMSLNAIEAMEGRTAKRLTLRVGTKAATAFFEVQDTGYGIKPDVLPHIFDPFFTTKKAETARGLGLSVSRSLARQYQGEIAVSTEVGVGSVFTLRLPVDTRAREALSAQTVAPAPPPAHVIESERALRVLVVDDEEFVANLVREVIKRKLKAESARASNGQEAIDLLSREQFDLIISDVRMPVLNGAELLKWVQTERPQMLKRFFFITGHEGSATNTDEISRSGVPVLRKPFTMDALVAQIQKVLA